MTVSSKSRTFWLLSLMVLTLFALLFRQWLLGLKSELPIYGKVPDFQLTERSGQFVSLSDLKGKVWVADFIFTRCMGICPMMSSKMKLIEQKMKDFPDFRSISFSVDPEYDTPQVLKKYAEHFSADPERWLFLTGDKKKIFQLSEQHFHLGVGDIPESEREAPEQSIQHSSKFVLVDGKGNIRGYYESSDDQFLEKLQTDISKV